MNRDGSTEPGGPRRSASVELRRSGDEWLVHDTAREKIHVLNASAGRVLELCDGRHSLDEIAAELGVAAGADDATVANDTRDIIAQFQSLGILDA